MKAILGEDLLEFLNPSHAPTLGARQEPWEDMGQRETVSQKVFTSRKSTHHESPEKAEGMLCIPILQKMEMAEGRDRALQFLPSSCLRQVSGIIIVKHNPNPHANKMLLLSRRRLYWDVLCILFKANTWFWILFLGKSLPITRSDLKLWMKIIWCYIPKRSVNFLALMACHPNHLCKAHRKVKIFVQNVEGLTLKIDWFCFSVPLIRWNVGYYPII